LIKKPEAPPPPPVQQEDLPVLTSFTMFKKGAKWAAVAMESQGLKVLRTKVVEMDPNKEHVRWVLDRSQHEFFTYGNSPFAPEVEA
jgi:hypothetical protein